MGKKIAIYGRVSTDEQNIKQQKRVCVDYVRQNGWYYRSFLDVGESGRISDRPQWQECLKELEKGKFDGLLVQRYDRVTRDLEYAIEFLKWLEDRYQELDGFKFYSVYDGIFRYKDDVGFHPDDEFVFKLKCLLSEKEVQDMLWRQRIGIERAKKEGKFKGGKVGRTWSEK